MTKTVKALSPRWALIGVITLIGAVVRFWNLGKSSFWHDEGFTVMMAQLPVAEIWERTARDVHPPLYYMTLHFWINLFGTSEVAIRSLSLAATVAIIPLSYLLVRRLWNERAAQLAALFVALGPLLVRYGQEARMYGLVALLVTLAVYCLIRAMHRSQNRWWILYSLSLAAALYTHYYAIFVLPALIMYVTINTSRKTTSGWWSYKWWFSNLAALALFVPWIPQALSQVMREKNFSWIPPTDATTLPSTLMQFMVVNYPPALGASLKLSIGAVFVGLLVLAWRKSNKQRLSLGFFMLYALAGPVVVYTASVGGSPYLERYFIFAAVGFYCLLAVMVSLLGKRLQVAATGAIILLFTFGIYGIQPTRPHNMQAVATYINERYQPGDFLLADMFLAYFDFSHYNHTGAPVHLWEPGGIDGYGESSLLKKREAELVVRRLEDIQPASGKVWVVRKLDKVGSRESIPLNWTPVGPQVEYADNGVQAYLVAPRR